VGFFSNLFGKKSGGHSFKKADLAKRWDLRGRTGQGSMSKVYQAYDKELGRMICLKLLDKEKTAKFEAKFLQMGLKKPPEGEICMGLKHDNCVRTFDYGITTQGEQFLVMEWIDGLGLNYLIETKNAQLNGKRIPYLLQLCDAVQYLHDTKYLHRDLCARNIMVDKEGVVKLIDFGLTIPYTEDFCKPGNRTGTLDILAPEIVKRQRTDHRVDLFALGATAFELFTFALPWERTANGEENLKRRMNAPPRKPQDFNKDLDPDLCAIISKSISREAPDRYASASDFKAALMGLAKQDY
jgi:eukaryotic-like serine/threonine-protein kinase